MWLDHGLLGASNMADEDQIIFANHLTNKHHC